MTGLLDQLVGGIIRDMLRYRYDIVPMKGGVTLPRASDMSNSDQPEILFGFYGEEEVAATLLDGYANLAFSILYWFPILILLGLLSYFC